MKIFYISKNDLKNTKRYALTITKNGDIISSTSDKNRGHEFNEAIYSDVILYYSKLNKKRGEELELGNEV